MYPHTGETVQHLRLIINKANYFRPGISGLKPVIITGTAVCGFTPADTTCSVQKAKAQGV